jgi:hypothetical protein
MSTSVLLPMMEGEMAVDACDEECLHGGTLSTYFVMPFTQNFVSNRVVTFDPQQPYCFQLSNFYQAPIGDKLYWFGTCQLASSSHPSFWNKRHLYELFSSGFTNSFVVAKVGQVLYITANGLMTILMDSTFDPTQDPHGFWESDDNFEFALDTAEPI